MRLRYIASPDLLKRLHLEDRLHGVNRGNRQPNAARLTEYTKAIRNNEWMWGGADDIRYNAIPEHPKNGTIVSGQHRLMAAQRANKAFSFFIRPVLEDGELAHIDTCLHRDAFVNAAMGSAQSQDPQALKSIITPMWQICRYLAGKPVSSSTQASITQDHSRVSQVSDYLYPRIVDALGLGVSPCFCLGARQISNLAKAFCVVLAECGASDDMLSTFKTYLSRSITECPSTINEAYNSISIDKQPTRLIAQLVAMWNALNPDGAPISILLGLNTERLITLMLG